MRVLITGITGFVGSYMAEYALADDAEVFGSSRWRSKTENIDHLRSRITLIGSDLRDLSSVRALLETVNPTRVLHLAAQSFVGTSWQAPAETLSTSIISQVNLLEGVRGLKMSPRFLVLLDQSHVKDINVQIDPTRLRPSDVMVLEGDPSKIEKATGWKVDVSFERTLKDLLGYWRRRTMSSLR